MPLRDRPRHPGAEGGRMQQRVATVCGRQVVLYSRDGKPPWCSHPDDLVIVLPELDHTTPWRKNNFVRMQKGGKSRNRRHW